MRHPRPFRRPKPPSAFDLGLTAVTVIAGVVALGLVLKGQITQDGGSTELLAMRESTAPEPSPRRLIDAPAPQAFRWGTTDSTSFADAPVVRFGDRMMRPVREIEMVVTAYSPDEASCGIYADGITASGYSVWTNGMKLVAADPDVLPIGSVIAVPGYDDARPVPVLDVGGAIKGNRLDVLFPTHSAALRWGVQTLTVTVYEEVE